MSNELGNNKTHGLQSSVADYASEAFEESSVCAVSTILATDNKPRKIFRSVVFLLFTVIFLYQCIAFLSYVCKYPTIVDIEIYRPEMFVSPAITFCNFNPIKRSKFCEKYPGNCTKPDEELCEENPRFCGTPDTQIPKDDIFDIDNLEELYDMNHEAKDMVDEDDDEDDEYNPIGPFPRRNRYRHGIAACFSYFSRVDSPKEPIRKGRSPIATSSDEMFRFDPREDELMFPEAKPGILIDLHSPFEAVNPFITGVFMRPGYLYRFIIKMSQEELLPHECLNYTEVWLKNNKTGYRSQAACRQKCIGDMVLKCYNCSEPFVLYPYPNANFCMENSDTPNLTQECKNAQDIIVDCVNGCKDDCLKMKFSYDVKEHFRTEYALSADRNESRMIKVVLEFPDVDIQKIVHKRQFQVLEVFSLLGGLLAFWIGLSMVQVIEVFDCIIQIGKNLFKNRSKGSENSTA